MSYDDGRKTNDKQAVTGTKTRAKNLSRRSLLKAGAALAGAAAGSDVFSVPTIWAQDIKDIELRHVGVSYSVVKAIGDQASKDLGFKVTMQNLDTSAAINRFITQPDSVDIADVEGWQSKLATKRGVLQGIEVKKIKEFDNILPIFTKGELEGHKIPRQGISPYEAMYITKPADTELHEGVTDYMTFLRSTTPTRSAIGPTSSATKSPSGRNCSTRNSRARRRSSTCRRSASWMRRCASRAPT
jgi:putative spermidine/putrescine transport system substrate-binding protein